MKFNKRYLTAFFVLLILEVIIALFVHDAIIRPYVGDSLVVILMYTFVRGIISKPIGLLPVYLFIFALIVELAQYYKVVYIFHLQNNKLLSTILGTSFDIRDILCYLLAALFLLIFERFIGNGLSN